MFKGCSIPLRQILRYHYDMVTRLGSNLHFESVAAEITNIKDIDIIRQNFGFDLLAGVTKVILDPAIEHYYLEIKAVEQ